MRFYALILAAGFSSRMGDFKPLLRVGDVCAITRTVSCVTAAGVTPIAVTGHRGDEILHYVSDIKVAQNKNYADGMFSSVVTGVLALPKKCDAFFMLPADCCVINPETLKTLLSRYDGSKILYPAYNGKRGHPPLIPYKIGRGLADYSGEGGARAFFADFPSEEIEVPDPGILMDMDTPEDYRAILRYIGE